MEKSPGLLCKSSMSNNGLLQNNVLAAAGTLHPALTLLVAAHLKLM
jgi:hypothetical protein